MKLRSFLIGMLFALGLGASAQFPPGFKMPSLWYNPALLMSPEVQKELHVSPQVATKAMQVMMREVMTIMPAMQGAMKGQTPTPQQLKNATDALERMEQASIKDLTPAQRERLHQITLQSYGPKALLDPKIAAQLGMSSSQKLRLEAALAKSIPMGQQQMSGMMGSNGPDMSKLQSAGKRNRERNEAVLAAILTPAQRQKWKALKGKPVNLGVIGQMMSSF